tara:strand:- start:885 stop:1199 length:315 start_codon:yes stop_codon:yes gene_type:complete
MEVKMSEYIKHILGIEKIKKEADALMLNKISKYEKEIAKLKNKAQNAETEVALIKATGMNSPEMIAAKKEIADLKKELQEVKDDNKKLALQINEMINRLRDAEF